ncbi:hypothetical protein PENARI_c026G02770 [Penicillium arizonense]|uniref:Uncharacterized protein n=1 Tax=Penicillium arizonense TaxID=1835702 RepID=A0A1F5L6J9_PENAI|nr:hypothetical protein PENARI_c026G02770 [Penicillium arizonense]OGE48676.1 hypothetical protein PENARI_c026G02770 [Penicillium arizonense]
MSLSKSESDVILNRANVALSRSQRLVASWLPQQTNEELANTKTDEELQREEDEIFTAVPETLGIGAPLPQKAADGSWNRTELDSNDKLRKQLLGKNYDRVMKAAAAQKAAVAGSTTTSASASASGNNASASGTGAGDEDDEDDDEDGRSAMIGKKKNMRGVGAGAGLGRGQKKKKAGASAVEDVFASPVADTGAGTGTEDTEQKAEEESAPSEPAPAPARSKGRKKATSYLDELLAERAKKRKKR